MLEWISLDLAYMCVASYSCIILYPGFDHRLWDGQPTQYIDFVPRSFYSPGPTSCYLRVLDLPADDNVTWQPSLVPRTSRQGAVGVLKSKGPAFRRGRQRSYRGRFIISPGTEASGLSTASAYGPSRTARLLTGISEGILALEFEAPKSLFKIILTAHFPSGVRVFPRSSASRSGSEY